MNENILKKLAKPLIVLATIIWGSSFVVMKDTLDTGLPTFYLLAFRFTAAAIILAIVFWKRWKVCDKSYVFGGCVMGTFLFIAYAVQTFGLERTTSGKNAFLTAVYCVIVPFLYWALVKKRPDKYNVIAAFLCIGGIGLVSLSGDITAGFSINLGDMLTLIGGFFFACHIVAVAKFSDGRDIFLLTTIQFASFAVLAWICAFVTRTPFPTEMSGSVVMGLAYLAVFSTCGALLFQNIGQKYTAPATAAVLLSLEAPFGVLFSVLLADEKLNAVMICGFVLIFVAVVCSETKFDFLKKKKADTAV
ncbi:MAG: DMT family transporter [Oscillospiraceae bacterium]